jgi:hypothetical protein
MKNAFKLSALLLVGLMIFAGCGQQSPKPNLNDSQKLNTDELARLLNFHTIKVTVPQSQRPFKHILIVLIKPDGTVVPKGGGNGFNNDSPSCNILVGYRVERGTISGRIELQDSNSTSDSDFNFTDPFADRVRVFGMGTFMNPAVKGSTLPWEEAGFWENEFLQLASDEPTDGTTNTNGDTILAIQLVK